LVGDVDVELETVEILLLGFEMLYKTLLDEALDLLVCVGFALEISVFKELVDIESVFGVVLEHLGDEVDEVFVVEAHLAWLVVGVELPELLWILEETLVVVVTG